MIDYPRVLIISNNPINNNANNGKTILSFFEGYPREMLFQLYFSNEQPTVDKCEEYFQLTDKDVALNLGNSGRVLKVNGNHNCSHPSTSSLRFLKNIHFIRWLREKSWSRLKYLPSKLVSWIDNINPELIFFCAGDSNFAYNIVEKIQKRMGTRLFTFITDDYITQYFSLSFFKSIRRKNTFRKLEMTLNRTERLFVISEKMSDYYKKIFDVESTVAINNYYPGNTIESSFNEVKVLVYAGSLYYNRDKELYKLSKALSRVNETSIVKATMYVYTNSKLAATSIRRFAKKNCIIRSAVNQDELRVIYQKSDILIHVESPLRKYKQLTKFSLSTKIPEYMSMKKCILGVGPNDVGSIEYINKFGVVINKPLKQVSVLKSIIEDEKLRLYYANNAYEYYCSHHEAKIFREKFLKYILNGK